MIDTQTAWDAVQRRDRAFDGRFVTGVLTTGIYCRPSCAARHPARGNVRFFADGAAARAAGLRPCKRCLPDDVARDEAAVLTAIDEIRSAEGTPSLAALALLTGYSPAHFQRVFKRAIGLSPAAYARVLDRLGIASGGFVMAGNSMKSDVLPVISLGGHGVFIPHQMTWAAEHADPGPDPRLHHLDRIADLPDLITQIEAVP